MASRLINIDIRVQVEVDLDHYGLSQDARAVDVTNYDIQHLGHVEAAEAYMDLAKEVLVTNAFYEGEPLAKKEDA